MALESSRGYREVGEAVALANGGLHQPNKLLPSNSILPLINISPFHLLSWMISCVSGRSDVCHSLRAPVTSWTNAKMKLWSSFMTFYLNNMCYVTVCIYGCKCECQGAAHQLIPASATPVFACWLWVVAVRRWRLARTVSWTKRALRRWRPPPALPHVFIRRIFLFVSKHLCVILLISIVLFR